MANAKRRPLYLRQREPLPIVQEAVGPGAGLDGCGKSRPQAEFDSRPFSRRLKFYPFRATWLLYTVYSNKCDTKNCVFARTLYVFLLVIFTMNIKYLVVRNSPFGVSNGKTRFSVTYDQNLYM